MDPVIAGQMILGGALSVVLVMQLTALSLVIRVLQEMLKPSIQTGQPQTDNEHWREPGVVHLSDVHEQRIADKIKADS